MKTKHIHWFIPVLILAFIISSCASTSKVSEDKSNAAKEFKKNPDKGIVYLYRPGRAVGAVTQTQIKINGNSAGGTGPGTFFMWELEPGTYVFSCYTPESSAAVEIDVKQNEHYFLRQDTRLGVGDGRVTLKKVDESTGKAAVKKYKMLQSTYIPSL